MPHLTALATLLAALFYALLSLAVSQARTKSGVKAPSMVGDPAFERAVRVQANTLEWMPIFLPALWLAALYVNDGGAAALGIVWIAGRALYARDYGEAAEKRGRGFYIQAAAAALLWAAALVGVLRALL
jgi:glutathione S-transferase